MDRANHAGKATTEKTKETSAMASKEANKAVMHDKSAPKSDRVGAAFHAAGDKVDEKVHHAKYEHEAKKATH